MERIRFIKTARRLDLALDEIKEMLDNTDTNAAPCGYVRALVGHKARELDQRIAEMIRLRDELLEIEKTTPISVGASQSLCPLIAHHKFPPSDPIRSGTEPHIYI